MTYMTSLHWVALILTILLFSFILWLTMRYNEKQSLLAPILANILITFLLTALIFYALDKYTKVARLENIVQKKVLINESFSISGQIRNTGKFTIGTCTLEVKIFNASLERIGTDSAIFVPKSAFQNFFKRDATLVIETKKKFVIAENLAKGEIRNFTVFMPYPPSYEKPYTRYDLSCY
ncbi:DUF2393 domain-containing protein [Sulfurospirillum barnesii]|uniref:DUF2393 domain-containing protein n=1 Tax=Sulfurospirillum barnesii (strain ATCC 700032 / DSM 10660 / SES-3) TaxID=760154 RepID=I3XU96_SULBS|nr:DUF2393 domain-containing protein [Sulfurospirillum barnesii]AFL67520.1 hypothetical protein Sulba_0193 [Sulfurospirillum barnesii SES-3]